MSDRLERLTTALEAKTISPENLLELAQISRRLPSPHEKESTDTVNIWVANDRYGRIIGQLSRLLRNPQASLTCHLICTAHSS